MADNLTINHAISYNKELVIPNFATTTLLNAYTPARAGALAQVGAATYKYDGASWVEITDASSSSSTYNADTINDL